MCTMSELPPNSVKKFQQFEDTMLRYHGEIERVLFAAEVECPHNSEILNAILPDCKEPCRFRKGTRYCPLPTLRRVIGPVK